MLAQDRGGFLNLSLVQRERYSGRRARCFVLFFEPAFQEAIWFLVAEKSRGPSCVELFPAVTRAWRCISPGPRVPGGLGVGAEACPQLHLLLSLPGGCK